MVPSLTPEFSFMPAVAPALSHPDLPSTCFPSPGKVLPDSPQQALSKNCPWPKDMVSSLGEVCIQLLGDMGVQRPALPYHD